MNKKHYGFTLTELLIVIAIIAGLAALLFPVFANARKASRRTVSVSNLRQCGVSLRMYFDDYGDDDALPNYVAAKELLKSAPTCDPEDHWRDSCKEDFGAPLVGSYAYVGATEPFTDQNSVPHTFEDNWKFIKGTRGGNPTLMMSIYYASNRINAFHDNSPDISTCSKDVASCKMPDRVLRLNLDGSVSMSTVSKPKKDTLSISWDTLFILPDKGEWVTITQ